MKRIRKLLWIPAIAAISGFSINLGYGIGVNRPLQRYVNQNLNSVMSSHFNDIGGISKPQIGFIVRDTPITSKEPVHILGAYEPDDRLILLPSDALISPETNLENLIIKMLRGKRASNVRETLKHELGHHAANEISQRFGNGIWPQREVYTHGNIMQYIRDANFINRLISEGIATYFERKGGEEQANFNYEEWKGLLKQDRRWIGEREKPYYVFYEGGYATVKPIIDKFGQYGILYLIRNPPTEEELQDVKKYQDEALKNLSTSIYFEKPKVNPKEEFNRRLERFFKR